MRKRWDVSGGMCRLDERNAKPASNSMLCASIASSGGTMLIALSTRYKAWESGETQQ